MPDRIFMLMHIHMTPQRTALPPQVDLRQSLCQVLHGAQRQPSRPHTAIVERLIRDLQLHQPCGQHLHELDERIFRRADRFEDILVHRGAGGVAEGTSVAQAILDVVVRTS